MFHNAFISIKLSCDDLDDVGFTHCFTDWPKDRPVSDSRSLLRLKWFRGEIFASLNDSWVSRIGGGSSSVQHSWCSQSPFRTTFAEAVEPIFYFPVESCSPVRSKALFSDGVTWGLPATQRTPIPVLCLDSVICAENMTRSRGEDESRSLEIPNAFQGRNSNRKTSTADWLRC